MSTLDVTGGTMHMPATDAMSASALHGEAPRQRWLARVRIAGWLARGFWLVSLLFSVYVFVITGPSRIRQIVDLYTLDNTSFEQLGFGHYTLPPFIITLDILTFAIYTLVGVLIFTRKSTDWAALFGSLALVTGAITIVRPAESLFFVDPRMRLPILLLFILGAGTILMFMYVFPNGRFSPRWMGWVALVSAGLPVGMYVQQALSMRTMSWPPPPLAIAALPALAVAAVAQIYRYRHTVNRSQQQQTKWVVFGVAVGAMGMLGYELLLPLIVPQVDQTGLEHATYIVVGLPLFRMTMLLLPLAIAMSVLRYRLWDIDFIIRRAILYGVLTAALAGLFAAVITLGQKILLAVTGQQSDLAAVAATLFVVAAFTPLKDYLQKYVDKRLKTDQVGVMRLQAMIERVNTRVSPVDPYQISRRLVDEAMADFNAKGGGVYWEVGGKPRMIYCAGDCNGDAVVTESLQANDQQPRIGYVTLNARKDGRVYTEEDRKVLQQAAAAIALAIDQDQTYG